jgi:predicted RNA binding protein YcfA (HicA-like mRNA interferase family)
MSQPTYGVFREVLLGLGFADRSVPGSHVQLEQAQSDTVVLLRPYREEEPMDAATLAGVRRILDEKGVVSRDRFDDLLQQRSLAG